VACALHVYILDIPVPGLCFLPPPSLFLCRLYASPRRVYTQKEVIKVIYLDFIIYLLIALILAIVLVALISMVFAFIWVPYKDSQGEYLVKK